VQFLFLASQLEYIANVYFLGVIDSHIGESSIAYTKDT